MTLTLDAGYWRRLLLIPAAALVTGLVIILHLRSLAPAWRALAALAWLGWQTWEIHRFANRCYRFRSLRLTGQSVTGRLCNGESMALHFARGTFVGRRFLWLRLQGSNGIRLDWPVRASQVSASDWRRLQVITGLCP